MHKRLSRFAMTLALVAMLFASVPQTIRATVDEGMFLPTAIAGLPFDQLKKRGLELKATDLYDPNNPSLADAIVQLGGGTGEFVSPDGLMLTNHHVAFTALVAASTAEKNLGETGFTARSRTEEIPAQGYTASITRSVTDITDQVVAGIPTTVTALERSQAISRRIAELTQAAQAQEATQGLRSRILPLYDGLKYFKFTSFVIRDVRIVYAPPKSIGYYGGDDDNFEWPRHCGDFTFMRAYVAPDGKSAAFDKANVPFKPKKFLSISMDGVKDNEFTFVMGYPGSTRRYRESYSVDYNQNVTLPTQIGGLRNRIKSLEEAGSRDAALKVRLQDEIFGLSNTLKAFEGGLNTLRRSNLVAQKQRQEAEFAKWVAANPQRQAKYGQVLPELKTVYDDLSRRGRREQAIQALQTASLPVTIAVFAAQAALEREKPEAQRNAQLLAQAANVRTQVGEALTGRNAATEQAELLGALQQAAALNADQRLSFLESRFGTTQGEARRQAETAFAKSVTEDADLNAESLAKLFDMTVAQMRAANKPYVALALELAPEITNVQTSTQNFNANVARLRPLLLEGMNEMRGGSLYPDANGTLRFTYGRVSGYEPRDGVTYQPFTELSGVLAKDRNVAPFDAPDKLHELFRTKNFGNYALPNNGDVPVNFLATTDIIGGNSGSPIMNGRGEIVGLVFDGNYEGLGNDFLYDDNLGRTIAVDIRYVLFLTDKFADAGYILREMDIKGKRARNATAAR